MAQRARFHATYRLAARAFELTAGWRAGLGPRAAAPALACGVADVVSAVTLRRSSRFHLGPRLAADALDTALWSTRPELAEPAVLTGVPLAIEAGARLGAAGVVVPVANAAVTALVARLRRRPTRLATFRWQLMGVGLGIGLRTYERSRRRTVVARHRRRLDAQCELAHLSGQHDVAMAADSVVDLVSRTAPLVSSDLSGRLLAGWKQSLAESTGARATYLGVAVARWGQRRNAGGPDLQADVECHVHEEAGTLLLSAEQVEWLERALDGLDLRGPVVVTFDGTRAEWRPALPRRIKVNHRVLVVPPDRTPGMRPFDPGPFGFAAAALWTIDTVHKHDTHADPRLVLPVAAGQLGLAAWAHRRIDAVDGEAHRAIVAAALVSGVVQALTTTATMRVPVNEGGIQRFPFLAAVNVVAMVTTLYASDLRPAERWAVATALAATVAVGLTLVPRPVVAVDFLAELLWTGAAVVAMAPMEQFFAEDASRLAADLRRGDVEALRRAFEEGRGVPRRLVAEARDAIEAELRARRSELDPPLADEAARRLDEIGRRLKEMA